MIDFSCQAMEDRVLTALNGGATALMISLAHRTGVFDAMAEFGDDEFRTSKDIAERAHGLDERYVRELLNGLVSAKIVHHSTKPDSDGHRTELYLLPASARGCLTRAASPNNMAVASQFIPMIGQVEDDLIQCFKQGGGVPYEKFPRFHDIMSQESLQTTASHLFSDILPACGPDLVRKLEDGGTVADVGCGSGYVLCRMAAHFPKSRFVGLDFSEEAITRGRAEAKKLGLANIEFKLCDVANSISQSEDDKYDLITAFDAIHDQVKPKAVLKNIFQALKPHDTSTFLMQDISGSAHPEKNIDNPLGPLIFAVSVGHCMTVSLSGGGDGLGAMWGIETATSYLEEVGFDEIQVKHLKHDAQNAYFVSRLRKAAEPSMIDASINAMKQFGERVGDQGIIHSEVQSPRRKTRYWKNQHQNQQRQRQQRWRVLCGFR